MDVTQSLMESELNLKVERNGLAMQSCRFKAILCDRSHSGLIQVRIVGLNNVNVGGLARRVDNEANENESVQCSGGLATWKLRFNGMG